MRTFPDFTWEWIIQSCERFCEELQTSKEMDALSERRQDYILTTRGIIAIVSKLREHPQLGKFVPMKSLMSLRWFPSNEREIELYYEGGKGEYRVTTLAIKGFDIESVIEKKTVAVDNVDDEIYALITQLRDD